MNTVKTLRRAERELNERYDYGVGDIAIRALYYASRGINEAKKGNISMAETMSDQYWAILNDLETLNVISNTEKWYLYNTNRKWIYKYYTFKPF